MFSPLDHLRTVAALACVATVLARALGPAMRGVLADGWVARVGAVGAFLSQALLIGVTGLLLSVTFALLRVSTVPIAFRLLATAVAGVVLGLSAPSSSAKLSPEFSLALAAAASVAGLLGTTQALASPRTRAVGVVLGVTSLGAITKLVGEGLLHLGNLDSRPRLAIIGATIEAGALVTQGIALAVALLWLATRKGRVASVWTTFAMAFAMVGSWLVERGVSVPGSVLRAIIGRATLSLIAPGAVGMVGLRAFFAVLSLSLGVVAAFSRGASPQVLAVLSFSLLCGIDADIPLCALFLTLAALAVALVAHLDEEGRRPSLA